MHTLLSPRAHGVLDYVTVAVFALAPILLELEGFAATASYALAGIHLAMTLLTAFPLGAASVIPFRVHGWVELAVAVVLIAAAFLVFDGVGRAFFAMMGVVILVVWAVTNYDGAPVVR